MRRHAHVAAVAVAIGVGVTGVPAIAGDSTPALRCPLLQVCEIVLSADEHLERVFAGDSARWIFASGVSAGVTHVLAKPSAPGLATDLVLLTSRRELRFVLRAVATGPAERYVVPPLPPTRVVSADASPSNESALMLDPDLPASSDSGPSWTISGDAPFRPTRVVSDAAHVYIALPSIPHDPRVYAIDVDGDENVVNSRIVVSQNGTRYIVIDGTDSRYALELGVDKHLQRILIQRDSHG